MKWSIVGLIVIGVTLALCVAVLFASLRAGSVERVSTAPAQATVAVATRSIPALTRVTSEMVTQRTLPADQVSGEQLRTATQVIGEVLLIPLVEGQAFTKACFAKSGPGVDVATRLEAGKRAVSISLSDYAGLDGLLYPGAQVDVLASFSLPGADQRGSAVSTTLLRGVRVLAVDHNAVGTSAAAPQGGGAPGSKSHVQRRKVTVLVDSKQAEALQLAMEHGSVSLAMRNPLDASQQQDEGTVLADGRLEQFADWMAKAALAAMRQEPEAEPEAAPPAEPAPKEPAGIAAAAEAATTSKWEVKVFRGSKMEIQTLELPGESTPAAEARAQTPHKE